MILAIVIGLLGAVFQAPETLWTTTLTDPAEPGEPLVVSGSVYRADGKTPVAGAVLYVYHTDAQGAYRRPGQGGNAPPRLRGWMKTDSLGRYEFHTIKPAPYPGARIPAHIHAILRFPDGREAKVSEFWFDGDPNLPHEEYRKHARDGRFSPILTLSKGSDGAWHGTRDLRAGP